MQVAPRHARSLQETAATLEPADVVMVSTPAELKASIRNGSLDIVITEHMDLTDLTLESTDVCSTGCNNPFGVIDRTRSIRVRATLSSLLCFSGR